MPTRKTLYPYSVVLQVEVFMYLFITQQDHKFVVHCLDCARKMSPTLDNIVVLNQYHQTELMDVYDNFLLGSVVSNQGPHSH